MPEETSSSSIEIIENEGEMNEETDPNDSNSDESQKTTSEVSLATNANVQKFTTIDMSKEEVKVQQTQEDIDFEDEDAEAVLNNDKKKKRNFRKRIQKKRDYKKPTYLQAKNSKKGSRTTRVPKVKKAIKK